MKEKVRLYKKVKTIVKLINLFLFISKQEYYTYLKQYIHIIPQTSKYLNLTTYKTKHKQK